MADGQAAQQRYAGFWMRFLAFLIDSVIASVILLPFGSVLGDRAKLEQALKDAGSGADPARVADSLSRFIDSLVWPTLWSTLILLVVVVVLWRYRGATPGKMAISARIVDSGTGLAPSTARLVVRFFAYFVSTIPLCLGFLWIAFDSRKQGWHDKLAGTLVVYDRKESREAP